MCWNNSGVGDPKTRANNLGGEHTVYWVRADNTPPLPTETTTGACRHVGGELGAQHVDHVTHGVHRQPPCQGVADHHRPEPPLRGVAGGTGGHRTAAGGGGSSPPAHSRPPSGVRAGSRPSRLTGRRRCGGRGAPQRGASGGPLPAARQRTAGPAGENSPPGPPLPLMAASIPAPI